MRLNNSNSQQEKAASGDLSLDPQTPLDWRLSKSPFPPGVVPAQPRPPQTRCSAIWEQLCKSPPGCGSHYLSVTSGCRTTLA